MSVFMTGVMMAFGVLPGGEMPDPDPSAPPVFDEFLAKAGWFFLVIGVMVLAVWYGITWWQRRMGGARRWVSGAILLGGIPSVAGIVFLALAST